MVWSFCEWGRPSVGPYGTAIMCADLPCVYIVWPSTTGCRGTDNPFVRDTLHIWSQFRKRFCQTQALKSMPFTANLLWLIRPSKSGLKREYIVWGNFTQMGYLITLIKLQTVQCTKFAFFQILTSPRLWTHFIFPIWAAHQPTRGVSKNWALSSGLLI